MPERFALLENVLGAESVYSAWFSGTHRIKGNRENKEEKNSNCLGNYSTLEVLKMLNLKPKLNFSSKNTLFFGLSVNARQMDSLY